MTAVADEVVIDKFTAPLYTQAEASRYLGLSESTFRNWARGYTVHTPQRTVVGDPVITSVERVTTRGPAIPFVGLAEGYALAAIRRTGVPLQRIRPALERLSQEMGVRHALASHQLFTDGAEVLFDYASHAPHEDAEALRDLVVVRDGQRVFKQVVAEYLQKIVFGTDGFATAVPLPGYTTAQLVADLRRSFGQPTFVHGGARLDDALSLFRSGEPLAVVAEEYGVPPKELEDAVRQVVRSS
ncbi:hypothetical protein [Phycicoccus sonneratiae]|uniref:Putative antitoxin VapB45-like DNA-binding HTH domain-containing protein n=1 Tax=Phycicoccus sonneratiae TaxID=2807628 RepID=A0ABS2CL83_9MICO|nr:hypothetical protein [Phycicoccus sonneraticus]MBM6399834.1 hypothetical protein [Phycicoccus sonneraticus]